MKAHQPHARRYSIPTHTSPSRASSHHPLSSELSGVPSTTYTDSGEAEEVALLPSPKHGHHHAIHKHSISGQIHSHLHAFDVFFKPPPDGGVLLDGDSNGVEARGTTRSSEGSEAFLLAVQPSKATSEWLLVGVTLLPKLAWGWLPFAFSFLGFSLALKLLLFITLFSVYSAAILYRLYLHTDQQGSLSLADIGEAAFGKRLGRRPVVFFCRLINIALPSICHMAVFATTGVCLPWISLMFAAVVLGLGQIQRLGEHPVLFRVVQPVLTAAAVAATLLKLLLLRAEHNRAGHMSLDPDADNAVTNLPYASDYVIAVVQLVSANYMGQHLFMEEMSGMGSPSSFQHSTAWAQVMTLLANLAVAVATLQVPHLQVRGFISFAFGADLVSRFLNLVMFALMVVKYLAVMHMNTKKLLPRLPHLLVSWLDPDGVESSIHIKPRQLWLLCSSLVVLTSFLVSGTFPHTFMYLSGLLTSVAYIPIAFTLPCLFSLKLLSNQITALEYTLSTWVIPVSLVVSLAGCWACCYHMVLKWGSADHGGSWGCNLLQ